MRGQATDLKTEARPQQARKSAALPATRRAEPTRKRGKGASGARE